MSKIPKNIFQIYHDKSLVRDTVKNEIMILNPTYNYTLFDFDEGCEFVKTNFKDEFAKNIIMYINGLSRYAHKSDLLRYCLLYVRGGVYLDVDLKQTLPLDAIINMSADCDLITSFGMSGNAGQTGQTESSYNNAYHPIISNGILFSIPGNPILMELIKKIIAMPFKNRHSVIIRQFHEYLTSATDCRELAGFTRLSIFNVSVFLFKECKIEGCNLRGREKHAFVDNSGNVIMYSNNYWNKQQYLNI